MASSHQSHPTGGEQIVRFVAVRCGIAQQRLMKLEEQLRAVGAGGPRDVARSRHAAATRVRALELMLASCIAETGIVRLPAVVETPVAGALRSTDPQALRGRWSAPRG